MAAQSGQGLSAGQLANPRNWHKTEMTNIMSEILSPTTADEAAEIVRSAAAGNKPIRIMGGGSKAPVTARLNTDITLRSTGLAGITLYEPSELVIAARAGTPLAMITQTLSEQNQRLSFDPVTYQSLLGTGDATTPTIGAVAACNLSGPRRIAFGAARDSLIGIEMINGKGEVIKNGGRVMKNVTGYDLTKLVCGSWGTLGLLTEVYFKVQPCPESERTLLYEGLDDGQAVACLCMAMGSPFEVTSATHIPPRDGKPAQTLIRIEGFAPSLTYRREELTDLLADYGQPGLLDGAESAALWASIAELDVLKAEPEDLVWKISVKPTDGPILGKTLRDRFGARLLYDWSGGLLWAAFSADAVVDTALALGGEAGDGGAGLIRSEVASLGGHATLMRGPQALRAAIPGFQPPSASAAILARAAKQSFDPAGLFNPGLMGAGRTDEKGGI
jgi:glycolate oxidase FAD binding subunit